jgi:hypothetical protein
MPRADGYGGRQAQRWVASVLATYGDRCHLCHHGDADSGDHIKPRSTHPDLMYVTSNGRPVHHQPCPHCGQRCNVKRKDTPMRSAEPRDALGFFERTP